MSTFFYLIKNCLFYDFSKKETPMEIETDVHDYCLEIVNGIIEGLKETRYYLTNPKLDFLTNVLRRLIEQRQNTRGKFNSYSHMIT